MRWIALVPILGLGSLASAQTPEPRPLPPSITNGVMPAAATAPKTATLTRFQNLSSHPPETVQALFGMRTAAEWLAKRQLANGRFLAGVNPALRTPMDGDSEFRQAVAAWGVCQAARFTGDDKLTIVGSQAILTLLSQITNDGATAAAMPGCGNRLGFCAVCALAIYELPGADAKMLKQAEAICRSLVKRSAVDGSIDCTEDSAADPYSGTLYPGLVLQALAAHLRATNEPSTREALTKGIAYYRDAFRKKPHPILAGTVVPAATELFLMTKSTDAAASGFEMADWLCTTQCKDQPVAGGFGSEPGFDSLHAARGLAAACHLARNVPDAVRYAKYRAATVEALAFLRGLQYTPDSTAHFEPAFRMSYIVGGIRSGVADGTIRTDATAFGVAAFQCFLESGAESRE